MIESRQTMKVNKVAGVYDSKQIENESKSGRRTV